LTSASMFVFSICLNEHNFSTSLSDDRLRPYLDHLRHLMVRETIRFHNDRHVKSLNDLLGHVDKFTETQNKY
jgi:hypothetical protein